MTEENSSGTCLSNNDIQPLKPELHEKLSTEIKRSERKFDCKICGKTFSWLSHVLRHERTDHGLNHKGVSRAKRPAKVAPADSKPPKSEVHRKIQTENKCSEAKLECDICGKTFPWLSHVLKHERPAHVLRHKRAVHILHYSKQQQEALIITAATSKDEEQKKHRCGVCNKRFSSLFNVLKHKKIVHGCELPPKQLEDAQTVTKHKCNVCHKYFTFACSLQRHKMVVHQIKPGDTTVSDANLKCPVCSSWFSTKQRFAEHFSWRHPDIVLKAECITFKSFDEFEKWKFQMEKDTASMYVKTSGKESSLEGILQDYACHKSAHYTGRGVRNHWAVGGTSNSGFFCPSRICTRAYGTPEEGFRIDVTFHSTHVGHECDLGRVNLSKPEKDSALMKLPAEVPVQCLPYNDSLTPSSERHLATTRAQNDGIKTRLFRSKSATASEHKSTAFRNLKEEARSIVSGFLPEIEKDLSDEQYKKIIDTMSMLKYICEAMGTLSNPSLTLLGKKELGEKL